MLEVSADVAETMKNFQKDWEHFWSLSLKIFPCYIIKIEQSLKDDDLDK